MNQVFKENTAKKLLQSIADYAARNGKPMRNIDIAHRLGFNVTSYITMVRNPKQYNKIPRHAWEKFRNFVNSGLTLEGYQFVDLEALKIKPATKKTPVTSPETLATIKGIIKKDIEANKPEITATIQGSHGKYTLNIDINITVNGKPIIM